VRGDVLGDPVPAPIAVEVRPDGASKSSTGSMIAAAFELPASRTT
jgi:hypothetical protein